VTEVGSTLLQFFADEFPLENPTAQFTIPKTAIRKPVVAAAYHTPVFANKDLRVVRKSPDLNP
jgi:hypothetical protein